MRLRGEGKMHTHVDTKRQKGEQRMNETASRKKEKIQSSRIRVMTNTGK